MDRKNPKALGVETLAQLELTLARHVNRFEQVGVGFGGPVVRWIEWKWKELIWTIIDVDRGGNSNISLQITPISGEIIQFDGCIFLSDGLVLPPSRC